MKSGPLSDPRFHETAEGYVLLRINTRSDQRPIYGRYNETNSVPQIFILDPQGEKLASIRNRSIENILETMQGVLDEGNWGWGGRSERDRSGRAMTVRSMEDARTRGAADVVPYVVIAVDRDRLRDLRIAVRARDAMLADALSGAVVVIFEADSGEAVAVAGSGAFAIVFSAEGKEVGRAGSDSMANFDRLGAELKGIVDGAFLEGPPLLFDRLNLASRRASAEGRPVVIGILDESEIEVVGGLIEGDEAVREAARGFAICLIEIGHADAEGLGVASGWVVLDAEGTPSGEPRPAAGSDAAALVELFRSLR